MCLNGKNESEKGKSEVKLTFEAFSVRDDLKMWVVSQQNFIVEIFFFNSRVDELGTGRLQVIETWKLLPIVSHYEAMSACSTPAALMQQLSCFYATLASLWYSRSKLYE